MIKAADKDRANPISGSNTIDSALAKDLGTVQVDDSTRHQEFELPSPPAQTEVNLPPSSKDQRLDVYAPKKDKPVKSTDSIYYILRDTTFISFINKAYRVPSTYKPCAIMLFEYVHAMNECVEDNTLLIEKCDIYHPLVINVYYAILFYIQASRAMRAVKRLPTLTCMWLDTFEKLYPPESLPIAGPTYMYFRSLCAIKCDSGRFADISPEIPLYPGPNDIANAYRSPHDICTPDVPRMLALIEYLNFNVPVAAQYDANGYWNPLATATDVAPVPLCGLNYGLPANWPADLRWNLARPGFIYPPESSRTNDMIFHHASDELILPTIIDISSLPAFLGMDDDMTWFEQFVRIASAHASFFRDKRTLHDVEVIGIPTALAIAEYEEPAAPPTPPTSMYADKYGFALRAEVSTTDDELSDNDMKIEAALNVNVRYPANHPVASQIGRLAPDGTLKGPFWTDNVIKRRIIGAEDPTDRISNTILTRYYLERGE